MIESVFAPWHAAVSALPFEWARYGFMRLALLAVLLVSPLLGALGTVVVAAVTDRVATVAGASRLP